MDARSARTLAFSVLWLAAAACTKDTGPTEVADTGSVDVSATTTGQDLDDSYTATIGSTTQNVGANGSVTFSGVSVGSQSVQLGGVASNCTVTSSNPISVTVTKDASVSAAFTVECEANTTPPPSVDSIIALAIASMQDALYTAFSADTFDVAHLDDFSFAESNELFNQAFDLEATNETAAFGAAITDIFRLEDNTDIRALVDAWDEWLHDDTIVTPPQVLMKPAIEAVRNPISFPVAFSTSQLEEMTYTGLDVYRSFDGPVLTHGTPPSITDHQVVLREVVRPVLIGALEKLAVVESSSFFFTITPEMQGETALTADPLELDLTEVFAMRAGLNVTLAAIDVASAYTLTPNPLSVDGFVEAMTPGSTFLQLTTGGADLLADALDRLQAAGPLVLDGLDALQAETDDQSDDIIKYDPSGLDGIDDAQIEEVRGVVEDVNGALTSPTTVTLDEGGADEYSFTLDVAEFFDDPITDFKALLPDYEVFKASEFGTDEIYLRWTALNLDEWTFPDPSFSGILPDIVTTTDLLDFDGAVEAATGEGLGLADFFYENSLAQGGYGLVTVDGVDCLANYYGGGSGCNVNGQYYYSGWVYLDSYDYYNNQEHVASFSLDGTGYLSAFGPYVVSDNGDGTYDVDMDMVDQYTSGSVTLTGVLDDIPGFTSYDTYGRVEGGSTLTISYLGSTWVFAKQY